MIIACPKRSSEGLTSQTLRDLFRRVAGSADSRLFDSLPTVAAAMVHGDHATVLLHQDYQQRRMTLTKVGGRWQITGSPDFR